MKRIFVVGVPRSGTSLVQSLLAAHSQVTSFTESHFFSRHYRALPALRSAVLVRDPRPRVAEFLRENGLGEEGVAAVVGGALRAGRLRQLVPGAGASLTRAFLELLDAVARQRSAGAWIEKTPRHLRFVPYLERLSAPHAKTRFVHVVRRGLGAIESLYRTSQDWSHPYDLDSCIRRWNRDLRFSARRVSSPADVFVLYDELAHRPEPMLRALLAELELDWEPELFDVYRSESESLRTAEESWKQSVGAPIQPRSEPSAFTLAARKHVLAGIERESIERIVARVMQQEPGG